MGILIRNAEALETLGKIQMLVIDKTGTLTEGRPSITNHFTLAGWHPDNIIQLAAAIESYSEHPLAAALVKEARARGLSIPQVEHFNSLTGGGVKGQVGNQTILIGKEELLEENGISGMSLIQPQVREWQQQAETVIFVAVNDQAVGAIGISDPIKSTSKQAIQELHQLGIKIVMLTGDHPNTANAVAATLGIDQVFAGVNPEQKHLYIKELKKRNYIVAMAGDGINDAPALAAANVGIAMGTGTDVAMESGDVILVKGDLRNIYRAILLSRAIMNNIRQNLFFAFIYNILGVPIAAGILYPFLGLLLNPVIAALAMTLSSVSVIFNSLRLKYINFKLK
jgi:Cu+-exporting ATPase